MNSYNEKNIKILKGLEAVKKRPGMYIGSTDSKGLHHLIWEILDNSIDESMGGHCDHIFVKISKDYSVIVEDNGRGIPTNIHPESKISAVQTIFTTLHSGGKFDSDSYKVSGGLHGVGASVVNALCDELEVWVYRENNEHYQKFIKGGVPVDKLKIIAQTQKQGTKIRFMPDFKIFKNATYEFGVIQERLEELAFLNKDVTIEYVNEINGKKRIFHFDEGIKKYLKVKCGKNISILNENIHFSSSMNNIFFECVFTYISEPFSKIYSFCNNIKTTFGGTHEEGFKLSLTKIINKYGEKKNLIPKNISILGDDCRDGLVCIIVIKHPNPQFEGQTKERLGNIDARTVAAKITYKSLSKFFDYNPIIAKQIVLFVINSARARIAAKQIKQNIRKKISNTNVVLPGKLSDCSSSNFYKRELFLVEGDSAGGSAKLARDRNYQAILPLKGKVINSQKEKPHKVLKNSEIQSIIQAIGLKTNDFAILNERKNNTPEDDKKISEMVIEKLRYSKIIIMTDADVDGSHITILLLTFFINYFPELIEGGFIYLARPPLFKIKRSNKNIYFYSDEKLKRYLEENNLKDIDIQRYKGLGEMNPDQLWETTMDFNKRHIIKISIRNKEESYYLFEKLMGSSGAMDRKIFIMKNAIDTENLDI